MKVLIVGSGGREHAIAWKVAQSPRLTGLWCWPGNPGTATLGENVTGLGDFSVAACVDFVKSMGIELVIVGPENYLEMGLADALRSEGVWVFGPSRSAAQIETSKAFSKAFMLRHAIPTARYRVFHELNPRRRTPDRGDGISDLLLVMALQPGCG